ncbi:cyclin J isoform X2 [Haematobia irritans]|uniref:cyclin J isoform X2 n=1 Tax=Haematobia irritans TaxID=7368 RepID=UPI003F505644
MLPRKDAVQYPDHENHNSFSSPTIPIIRAQDTLGAAFQINNKPETVSKYHSICEYSDDIFISLKEAELKRRTVWFRSLHIGCRPSLIQLMKVASEKHKLARTTLHLGIYLLDCFMDNSNVRSEKLKLTAMTCLILAAKIEEADVDMPKFGDLNKLMDKCYSLQELKSIEVKVLSALDFNIIRPTAATFAEYFANRFITLQDFHVFCNHWYNEMTLNQYHHYNQQLPKYSEPQGQECASLHPIIWAPCPYGTYEDMVNTISKTYFVLIDVSLNYLKFANARPSIIAASCLAASRQMHGIFPTWTPFLIELTTYTSDIISPFVEAILAIYRVHCKNEYLQDLQTPSTPIINGSSNLVNIVCDSPDSGIISESDKKSTRSDTDDDDTNSEIYPDAENETPNYYSEYPLQPKRRRLF